MNDYLIDYTVKGKVTIVAYDKEEALVIFEDNEFSYDLDNPELTNIECLGEASDG